MALLGDLASRCRVRPWAWAVGLTLLCACSSAPLPERLPWQPAQEWNARLPSSVRVFRLVDEELPLRAWYVTADVSDPELQARLALADGPRGRATVSELAAGAAALVTVNAGYFRREEAGPGHDGLLLVGGTRIARSDARHPALGFDREGLPHIAWTTLEDEAVVALTPGEERADGFERPPRRRPSRPWPMHELVQGRPALVLDGLPYRHWLVERHPRTAAGIDGEGRLIVMVVDGRSRSSRGATLDELTHLMVGVGCVDALNLDGGGSTTLVIGGELVNRPVGGRTQREVPSALTLVRTP